MSRIYSIAAQKGGTGKSTTASCLAAAFYMQGASVLLVDMDPQATLTYFCGGNANGLSSYDLMQGHKAGDIIQHCNYADIIPANLKLAGVDAGAPELLKKALKPLTKQYDVIIIDNAPTLGALLINGLIASTDVIIPIKADATALQSLYQLSDSITAAQSINKALNVAGIVVTQYSKRTCLSRDILDAIKEKAAEINYPVFDIQIRSGVAIQEAQLLQKSIFEYAPKSNPAQDYMMLAKELSK